MKLRCEKKHVIEVQHSNLEAYIEHCWGLETGSVWIAEMEECTNGTYLNFDVESTPLGSWEQDCVDRFLLKPIEAHLCLAEIMNQMCINGWLEAGEYFIYVSW